MDWRYRKEAGWYRLRPNYSDEVIKEAVGECDGRGLCIDVGAGTGNLGLLVSKYYERVIAVEPSDEMREIGEYRTRGRNIEWRDGSGEALGMRGVEDKADAVMYGSSFNVVRAELARSEAWRVLKDGGILVCIWNYRDLEAEVNRRAERVIRRHVDNYGYGSRREDPKERMEGVKGYEQFNVVRVVEGKVMHRVGVEDFCDGWRSVRNEHWDSNTEEGAEKIDKIVGDMKREFNGEGMLEIEYTTKAWVARKIWG